MKEVCLTLLTTLHSRETAMGRKAKDGQPIATFEIIKNLVLRNVGEKGNVWVRWKEIRADTFRAISGCTDSLGMLAAIGLVLKRTDPKDARRLQVKLTPEGEKQYQLLLIGDELNAGELEGDAEVE